VNVRRAFVIATTQNIPTTTSGTTMEEFPTTATLNEPASTPSTTQSDSTTPTAEATTVTGLQAPTTGK